MKIYMGKFPNDPGKQRKIEIRIDNYDLWSMHDTLSLIITPMLKKLKEQKNGAPFTDDEDVPDHLKDAHIPKENEWDTGVHHFEKWDWILDEMIWAFEQDTTDWDDQFHSGECDFIFEENDDGFHTMLHGPNHTHTFDYEGAKAWEDRMKNGFRLFAKYYFSLWD